jgi:HEAT repeat protein
MPRSRTFRRLVRFALGLVVLCALGLSPAPASAQFRAEGVVYSFLQVRLNGTDQFLLVPMPTEAFRADAPLQAVIPVAFGLLRNAKQATYGNTSITLSDADIAARRVSVHLDPQSIGNFDIIAGETVLTFAQLGIERVVFPGIRDQGLAPEDIVWGRFELTLPLWQALAAGPESVSLVRMPDGSLTTTRDVFARMQSPAVRDAVLSLLASDNPVVLYQTLMAIPSTGLTGYLDSVRPLVQSADPALRVAAITALAAEGSEGARQIVAEAVDRDPDPQVRATAATLLSASADPSDQTYEIFYRAFNLDPPGRLAAIAELTALQDPRVNPQLLRLLQDPDPVMVDAGIQALLSRGAAAPLALALQDEGIGLAPRMHVARTVSRQADGAPRVDALAFLLRNSAGADAALVVRELVDAGPPLAAAPLVARVADGSLHEIDRRVAVRALGRVGSPEDLEAIEAACAAPEALQRDCVESALAIAERAGSVAPGTGPLARAAAAFLQPDPSNADPVVRAASARGMARIPTPTNRQALVALLDDPDARVQGAAIHALGTMEAPGTEDVVQAAVPFLQSGDPMLMEGAAAAIAGVGQLTLRPVIVDLQRSPHASVREAGLRAAARMVEGDGRDVQNALAAGLRDQDPINRVVAAELLGGFPSEVAVLALSSAVNDAQADLRHTAIEALGRTAQAGAVPVLIALLEDRTPDIRMAALAALRVHGGPSIAGELQVARSRVPDPAVVEGIDRLLVELGAP